MCYVGAMQPADCFVSAAHLAGEVERIRVEMGRPADTRPPVRVTGASPRECWFQALAVFRKADRLCHELGGDPLAIVPHAPPIHLIEPRHVHAVISAAAAELAEVTKALGLGPAGPLPARTEKTPSDVFGVLATTDRQINLLLERPFAPADVFQQVALAVSYAARLTGEAPPAPAAYVGGKRPADCYARLTACLGATRTLIERAGHPVIAGAMVAGDETQIVPSDVFDLASLVLGEIAFLHALKADANPPHPWEGNAPGRKLPSHVWQLAGVLEAQLQRLVG